MSAFILYTLVAVALLAAAARMRNGARLRSAIILYLLPLVVLLPSLVRGHVYAPYDIAYESEPLRSHAAASGIERITNASLSDQARLMIPWRAAVRDALARGEWPLLNPAIFCGDILAAASEPAPYHPVNLLSFLLPLAPSLNFVALMQFFLAAFGAFLFLRDTGRSEIASLFGSAVWTLAFFFFQYVGTPLAFSALMLPFLLRAVHRLVERPALVSSLNLAMLLALLLLAGHPETALKVVAISVVYAACAWLAAGRRQRRAFFAAGLGAGILALALSAIHLLPFLEALPHTFEADLRETYYRETDRRSLPLGEAVARLGMHFFPQQYGFMHDEPTPVRRAEQLVHVAYAGTLFIPLAILGIVRGRRNAPEDRAAPVPLWSFHLFFIVFGLLAAVRMPLVAELFAYVPLFDIAVNERFFIASVLAFALFAAAGVDALLDAASRRLLALAAALVAAAYATITLVAFDGMRALGLSFDFVVRYAGLQVVPLVLLALAVLRLRARGPIVATGFALLLLQRVLEMSGFVPSLPERAFYPDLVALKSLPPSAEPYRVVATGYTMTPNLGTHYRLEDPRGFHGMTNLRLFQTYPLWSVHQHVFFNRVDDLTRPFLSFLNVRYALRTHSAEAPHGWKRIASEGGYEILENTAVVPRTFVPSEVRIGVDSDDTVLEMRRAGAIPSRAWINASRRGGHVPETLPNGPGRASTRRIAYGYAVDVTLENDGWVVMSQTAWPGWRVREGEIEHPVFYANHAFIGFHLRKGVHRLEVTYWPKSFVAGRAITLVALLLMAAGYASSVLRSADRRPA